MPSYDPDLSKPATPKTTCLRSNAIIWRVHSSSYAAHAFNPTIRVPPPPSGPVPGGRFDATPVDSYAYLYAGSDTIAASAESVFRDRPPTPQPYIVPAIKLKGLILSKLMVAQDLELAKLHGNGLSAIGQDAWLTACGASEYPTTRQWAAAVRHWNSTVCGLAWHPRNDNSRLAYVFFDDRCPPGAFVLDRSYQVDIQGRGFSLMQQAATKHNAVLNLP